jgi:hypothetical protein
VALFISVAPKGYAGNPAGSAECSQPRIDSRTCEPVSSQAHLGSAADAPRYRPITFSISVSFFTTTSTRRCCVAASRAVFGGGEALKPIEICLEGHATGQFEGVTVPTDPGGGDRRRASMA